MKKVAVYQKTFLDEQGKICDLQYSILIGLGETGEIYGVEIQKIDANGTIEVDFVHGISECREDVEDFIDRLWKTTALPVELAALCDDFISEKENADIENNVWVAC